MKILAAVLLACTLASCTSPEREDERATAGTDVADTTPASRPSQIRSDEERLLRNTYNSALLACGNSPEEIYRDAGTRDSYDAADWFAKEVSIEGVHRNASRQGCFDALIDAKKHKSED